MADKPTHVSVPIETLQAIHATLAAHADTIRQLLPDQQTEEAIAAATAARLKQQR